MYVYVYLCICMHIYVYLCIVMSMYVYVCIFMYMYVYIYVYLCICMYNINSHTVSHVPASCRLSILHASRRSIFYKPLNMFITAIFTNCNENMNYPPY